MPSILLTSGFRPTTLEALRRQWDVIDIPEQRAALNHLQQGAELPLAVVIGRAVTPPDDSVQSGPPRGTLTSGDLPAHEMLARTLAIDAELPVIVSTRKADSNAIVYLVQRGAFDYVIEPAERTGESVDMYTSELEMAVARAVRWRRVVLENRRLRAGLPEGAPSILGNSPGMRRVRQLIEKVAPTPATVLVVGESGTGKELVARAIHEASGRRDQPLLEVNCGALEDTLLRSELFGHERGAFTGADTSRPGLLREARRGTLFLDEIATVSPAFQTALLRVLEERTVRPVGGQQEYPVHCRMVAASNQDLAALIASDEFREDLYYRLNVFQIDLPPLRQRPQDVPILAQHLLDQMRRDYGKPAARFSPAAMNALQHYRWPGNVRELRNVVERALVLCDGGEIQPAELGILHNPAEPTEGSVNLRRELERVERRLISETLERTGGNLAAAARALGLKRPTLHYRMRQLGLH